MFIISRSALPWQTKKSSLAGEVARRVLNCDDQAWIEDGREIINKFCGKLMLSGYSEHERQIIINEGENTGALCPSNDSARSPAACPSLS